MTMSGRIYVLAAARTPIGSAKGNLASLKATELGSFAVSHALKKASIEPPLVDEVYMGCALSAGLGQNPAQSVAVGAGVPVSRTFITVNKVCASGMKAIMLGAQQIQLGVSHIVVAGGIESMSNVPGYVYKNSESVEPVDGVMVDGLVEASNGVSMGIYAEECAVKNNISRKDQDDYAVRSYKLSIEATNSGLFKEEIAPVKVTVGGVESVVDTDQIRALDESKMRKCRPAFCKEKGTVTGPNSSSLSDGAACLVLASEAVVKKHNLKPVAMIRAFADAAHNDPSQFTVTPSLSINKCLSEADLDIEDIDFFEINEAFSVVSIVNMRLLNISLDKLNVHGGAVSMGHPLGCSGARILVTLINVLRSRKAKTGCASICNGGGGASTMVVEALS